MIDRDGESFRYILAYLRQKAGAAVVLPEKVTWFWLTVVADSF